jgi:hypothetical protein
VEAQIVGYLQTRVGNLNRLLSLSVTPEQRQQVKQLFGAWKQQPKQIQFIPFGKGEFQIVQYHAKSIAAATDTKLHSKNDKCRS